MTTKPLNNFPILFERGDSKSVSLSTNNDSNSCNDNKNNIDNNQQLHASSCTIEKDENINNNNNNDIDRNPHGRHLLAKCYIPKGRLIFCERPIIALQSLINRVQDKVMVCNYCHAFCGDPSFALQFMGSQQQEQQQQQNQNAAPTTLLLKNSSCKSIVPCKYNCGHFYCSKVCQIDDWVHGGHGPLCTGIISDDDDDDDDDDENNEANNNKRNNNTETKSNNNQQQQQQKQTIQNAENDNNEIDESNNNNTLLLHPLLQFKQHAAETNEIFLLIATWIVRILINKDDYNALTDFCMEPWWEVACLSLQNKPMKELHHVESSLKQLCQESFSFLQQAWQANGNDNNNNDILFSMMQHEEYKTWLSPLGISKLIGSIEQNCMGIRRKHPLRWNVLQDLQLRTTYHKSLLKCLEEAEMIGDDDDDDDDDDDEEEEDDDDDDNDKDPNQNVNASNSNEGDVNDNDNGGSGKNIEFTNSSKEWDYTVEDVSTFLSNLQPPNPESENDDWDDLFRPLDGTAMYAIACKMNHSCDPNVIVLYKTRPTYNNGYGPLHPLVAYCVALRDIEPNEELTISYISSQDPYLKRQESLADYGFICTCPKCEKDKQEMIMNQSTGENNDDDDNDDDSGDGDGDGDDDAKEHNPTIDKEKENNIADDLFGSDDDDDDDDDDDGDDENEPDNADDDNDDNNESGDAKLQTIAERLETSLNQSIYASIPVPYLASVSTFVIQASLSITKEIKSTTPPSSDDNNNITTTTTENVILNLINSCVNAIRERDFSSCRIVGTDLECTLYHELQRKGSWPNTFYRLSFHVGAICAALGFAQEGCFLVAMQYLDKAIIMGWKYQYMATFFYYVQLHASQMAYTPCPPAIGDFPIIPNIKDETSNGLLQQIQKFGLQKPIEYPVKECAILSPEIAQSFTSQSTPLVFRQFASDWPAISQWKNLQTFWVRQYGHRLIPIEIGSMYNDDISNNHHISMKEELITLREFVETYLVPSNKHGCWTLKDAITGHYFDNEQKKSMIAYLAQHPLLDQIPELITNGGSVPAIPHDALPNPPTQINVWIGTGGTRTPLHYDSYDNLLVQIVGAKYVRLYNIQESSKLYITATRQTTTTATTTNTNSNKDFGKYGLQGNMSPISCEELPGGVSNNDKYPLAETAVYTEVLLLPGDCLFIPARCWHYVRSLSTSMSVNYWF